MSTYVKKPVKVEAFQMTKERRWDNSEWPEWLNEAWNKEVEEEGSLFCDVIPPHTYLHISTLEGVMDIDWNDYIIQGVQKEIYPCKPSIFKKTYTKVKNAE